MGKQPNTCRTNKTGNVNMLAKIVEQKYECSTVTRLRHCFNFLGRFLKYKIDKIRVLSPTIRRWPRCVEVLRFSVCS
ncbi:hypothetical protein TcasGA2_TC014510 [Tribolium castaneum]|uniref:Uncharacterized protein n=1 Tax=Tribolium castaneum TaxID=7070 RepID=D6WP63_TRICA|nr:hypothetical protein TcasGA2_TC014510 [Tribolium castaneum]